MKWVKRKKERNLPVPSGECASQMMEEMVRLLWQHDSRINLEPYLKRPTWDDGFGGFMFRDETGALRSPHVGKTR